jgi:hypothetical protein
MTTERGPSFRLGLLLVVLGGLAALGGVAVSSLAHAPAPDLAPPAREARARIEQALAARAQTLEPKATEAARVAELAAALDMGADQDTFQDLFESEDWWAPFRAAFPLSGVVVGNKQLAVIGAGAAPLAGTSLVREARERGSSSGLLGGRGRAFLAAAAKVSRSKRAAEPPVVVLGTVLDEAAFKDVARATGDAFGLSDHSKLIEAEGTGEPRRALAALVGKEGGDPTLLDDGRVATSWPLGTDLWLVAATAPPPPVPPPGRKSGLWAAVAGGALFVLGLITMGSGRGRRAEAPSRSGEAPVDVPGAYPVPISGPGAQASGGLRAPTPAPGPSARTGTAQYHAPQPASVPMTPPRARPPDPGPSAAASPGALPVADAPGGSGVQLGRYRLMERIGEGGMAEIFFAAAYGAEDFVRHFVVKRMHPHLARSREVVNQFIDEARLQAGLVHSNIVPVFDFGKAGDEYFLALEYIHGRDVGQLVQRHMEVRGRPLDLPVAFYIAHEVLEALAFAHSQISKEGMALDIVHRDVAPGNVLVSYRGEVKLTDFGIAKAERRISRTEVGMVKGNAGFMSPEQARGESVDKRSDVFSAGVVLFYCLTGQLLYRGETTMNRLLRAAVGPATSQFSQIEKLPLPAAQVLRRALALDPDKRYPNATEFQRGVKPHAASRPELAELMDALFPAAERRDMR